MAKKKISKKKNAAPTKSALLGVGSRVRVTREGDAFVGCVGAVVAVVSGSMVSVMLDHKHAPKAFQTAYLSAE